MTSEGRHCTALANNDGIFWYTNNMKNHLQGFTLIELLVVVLIIGILSAVALPQYQKAVEKSRATQAFALARTLAAAQEAYHIENGAYATTFDELPVDIPWSGAVRWVAGNPAKSNEDWSVQIYHQMLGQGISIGRISGPYAGGGFLYLLDSIDSNATHQLICMERTDNTEFPFTIPAGSYCQKLFPDIRAF